MITKLFLLFPNFRVIREDDEIYEYCELEKQGATEEELRQFLIQASDKLKAFIIKEVENLSRQIFNVFRLLLYIY
jgi:hypothetical protein